MKTLQHLIDQFNKPTHLKKEYAKPYKPIPSIDGNLFQRYIEERISRGIYIGATVNPFVSQSKTVTP